MGEAMSLGGFLFSVCGAAVVAWGIWRAWTRPQVESDDTPVVNLAERRQESSGARWSLRGELARLFLVSVDMSSAGADQPLKKGVDASDCQPSATALPPIAMPDNDGNTELTGNVDNASAGNSLVDIIPTDARELIRFQAKAEALADMMNAGILGNQAKSIEVVFHCARAAASRPESTYQKALGLINRLAKPAKPEYISDMRERIFKEEGVA